MRKNIFITLLIGFFFAVKPSDAQTYDPFIQEIINQTNLDTLVSFVKILSGEHPVMLNGFAQYIPHRVASEGNELAGEYIVQKMNQYGFESIKQKYSSRGTNIYAIQAGTVYPDQYYMICAHYDAVTYFAADDNASGTAGVLEAARILKEHDLDYSVIYAFWDEEEIGLVGSRHFAQQASESEMDILGVLNFEMAGWDSTNDGLMDIHTRPVARSVELAEYMFNINEIYDIALQPVIYNPGTDRSDHASFWNYDYSAICFIQAFEGGDFNDAYHTIEDRIDLFNLPYFHEMARLGNASIAALAKHGLMTSVSETTPVPGHFSVANYPNPFNHSTTISYTLPDYAHIRMDVYDTAGRHVKSLLNAYQQPGSHRLEWTADDLSSGVYFIFVQSDNHVKTHKMVLIK